MNITRKDVEENIDKPAVLESLYQRDRKTFGEVMARMHEEGRGEAVLGFWHARLSPGSDIQGKRYSFWHYGVIALLAVLTWIPVKMLTMDSGDNALLYLRMIPIVFSLALSLYFQIRDFTWKTVLLSLLLHALMASYFLWLPRNEESQSATNALLFGVMLLWFMVWFSFSSAHPKRETLFSDFMQTTAETILWSTLCLLGGLVLVFLSINLFQTIGINADRFYMNNIATLGVCAAPFVSLLITEKLDKIRLSAILSTIFLPLFLVSLVLFGAVSIFAGIKPYENRDVFIVYNLMLVIVIGLLVFTRISGQSGKFIDVCAAILTVLTIILDAMVLSAIIYRIKNYGVTPNKLTLLISNAAMLGNLIYILYVNIRFNDKTARAKKIILYLPVYGILALAVVFLFPGIFQFK